MNVFKEMALSMYSFESYRQFLKNKKGKVFGFGVLLVTIYFAMIMIPPAINDFAGSRNNQVSVPNLRLEDGTLWVEDVVEINTGTTYIYIDTDPNNTLNDARELEEYLDAHSQVLLINSKKMILKNRSTTQEVYFSDLGWELDRKDVEELIPRFYTVYMIVWIFVMIFAYIGMNALFFFGVLFVALLGMIAASGMKYKLTFGQLYVLGVYSRTLPLLIKAIVSYLPFHIPMFWIINFGVSFLIIVMAIQKMKEQEGGPSEFTSSGAWM